MLRCPADGYPLHLETVGAASFAVCENCSGLWLTREALLSPSVDPSDLPRDSRVPSQPTRRRRKIASCPTCRRQLLPERVEGIDIDRCVHCAGVWLDRGEYDAVRHHIEHPQAGVTARPQLTGAESVAERVGEKVEVVLTVLFKLFFWI
jgi:Zn-finger nucleic acid-binding protein